MNSDTKIIIGITGSIACYKIADLVSRLSKENIDMHVIMTKNAKKFISPLIFEALTGNKCITDTFINEEQSLSYMSHIELSRKADLILIAPATANIISKLSCGLADDILTTTVVASKCKKIIAPAMNTNMLYNPIIQNNINTLKSYGYDFIDSQKGILACKEEGYGKLADIDVIYETIIYNCFKNRDLEGKKILVTAGPTLEKIDDVRFISNHSSGKMGYAIAKSAMLRGAQVTLVSGPSNLPCPMNVNVVNVTTAFEMSECVKSIYRDYDIIVKSAAVSDYAPMKKYDGKIKKHSDTFLIECKKTEDILSYIGNNRLQSQVICGFCMETENLINNAVKKLYEKNLDLIVANNINDEGAGFKVDTNSASIITKHETYNTGIISKVELSDLVLDKINVIYNEKMKRGILTGESNNS